MLDPVTTPLLLLVLGKLADEIIGGACRDYLKGKLKSLFSKAEKLDSKDALQLAYESAMQQAYETCCEVLLRNIETFGVRRSELPKYRESLETFIKDRDVAVELFRSIEDPNDQTAPSPDVLKDRWQVADGRELPSDQLWLVTTLAYRNQALHQSFLSDQLRGILTGKNIDKLLKEIIRLGGVKTKVRRDKYSQRMRTKFSPVDLANLMPSYAEDPGRMVIRDVFVPQNVRENPPPVEIPKDLAERLREKQKLGFAEKPEFSEEDLDEKQLEKLRAAFVNQSPNPVLEVIAATGNRLLVLTGEPGSGKSTLMRYLLTGVIEPPVDRHSGLPLPWTQSFEGTFPLLIELRDFYALRRQNECDSFLEYVAYMGKTDHWFLDDHAVHGYLDSGPSLVMFDGLDEIFDCADRQRVMQEIAGFVQRYPRARIIVTSRPVDYKEQLLREAGFAHFGIEDLNDAQIDSFIRGWFELTFPQQFQERGMRIERVLSSVRQSRPIRLLAGNPMLLTIMALLAREEELPRERAKFYEKAVEVLCHHWDANRNLQLPEDRYLNADDKKDLLRRIAMRMVTGLPYDRRMEFIPFQGSEKQSERSEFRSTTPGLKGNIIAEDDLEQEIQVFLIDEQWQTDSAEARKAARRVIRQLRERNYILCLRGPHLYGFVHRTFLEYLTATQYVQWFDKQPQQMTEDELIDLFDRQCHDDDWREVLRLICGQIDEQFVGRIVEHLATRADLEKWDGNEPLPEIPLAIRCLSETRNAARLESSGTRLLQSIAKLLEIYQGFEMKEPLLSACRELGQRWPGKDAYRTQISDLLDLTLHLGSFWTVFVSSVYRDRGMLIRLASTTRGPYRGGPTRAQALSELAVNWPDDSTRQLLTDNAVQDENSGNRHAALRALVSNWSDETTRKLLVARAVQDDDYDPRRMALRALAEHWPDEATRKLLAERAIQDRDAEVRNAVLNLLVRNWPDLVTRQLLAKCAVQDEHYAARMAALHVLAEHWLDEATRKLLAERSVQDENEYPRRAALRALAENWPDETTLELLESQAESFKEERIRSEIQGKIESLREKLGGEGEG